jgi:hypothetical protein
MNSCLNDSDGPALVPGASTATHEPLTTYDNSVMTIG